MNTREFEFQPTLSGDLLKIRPLKATEFELLFEVASDPLIWELHPQRERYKKEVFEKFFTLAVKSGGAFVIEDHGQAIGSSRFYDFRPEISQVSIGYTFLARKYWGGKFNREMKKLMLEHAFKFVDNVTFEIGVNNLRSRKAIEKLGGKLVSNVELDGEPHVVYMITKSGFNF
ncbi:acetyltransferase [Bdellovibrio bacteriovorus]|uniref:Acetyltransferase n=1 Tax=Bdellovibrio bacteriovorus TaxID=959 RepID=A0A162GFJ8_BDEBC|nr:GNAT family N-acetyltransferase [Bdellovibrio bacteriovorus]KYG68022.1 acetyltransferase [Bdellovibrio bacteriovorus]